MSSKFVEWLFDLYLASTLNPNLDNYVKSEATAFRRKHATRLKARELRVLNRLEQSPQAAKLLTSCLRDLDFRL